MRHGFECGGPGLARDIDMTVKTETQVSAGGAAFRKTATGLEVALISVGNPPRWQLPRDSSIRERPLRSRQCAKYEKRRVSPPPLPD